VKNRKILAGFVITMTIAILCLDVFAGIAILKNGQSLTGRIIERNNEFIILGYRGGTLKISSNYVKDAVDVRNLSEYGRQAPLPGDEEISNMDRFFLNIETPLNKSSTGIKELRTKQYVLAGGEWKFSFELPMEWAVTRKTKTGVLTTREDLPGTMIYAETVETPSVSFSKQAILTEACIKAELGGFSTIYAKNYFDEKKEIGSFLLLGTYAGPKGQTVLKTSIARTPSHTFILSLFVPIKSFDTCYPIYSLCRESAKLEEMER